MVYMGSKMSKSLHKSTLKSVFNAPVNLFFDVTPLGRILTNFTMDIGRCDRTFFNHIIWVFDSVPDCLLKLSVVIYFFPILTIIVAINFVLIYKLQKKTYMGNYEGGRLNAAACTKQ